MEGRPARLEGAVNSLTTGARYNVHYFGAPHSVEEYTLLVLALCTLPPVTDVSAAEGADWADTSLFEFIELESASGAPAFDGVPEGFGLCGMVLDDQRGGDSATAAESPICSFTAGAAGELIIDLRLIWVVEAEQTMYESTARGSLTISE